MVLLCAPKSVLAPVMMVMIMATTIVRLRSHSWSCGCHLVKLTAFAGVPVRLGILCCCRNSITHELQLQPSLLLLLPIWVAPLVLLAMTHDILIQHYCWSSLSCQEQHTTGSRVDQLEPTKASPRTQRQTAHA